MRRRRLENDIPEGTKLMPLNNLQQEEGEKTKRKEKNSGARRVPQNPIRKRKTLHNLILATRRRKEKITRFPEKKEKKGESTHNPLERFNFRGGEGMSATRGPTRNWWCK